MGDEPYNDMIIDVSVYLGWVMMSVRITNSWDEHVFGSLIGHVHSSL